MSHSLYLWVIPFDSVVIVVDVVFVRDLVLVLVLHHALLPFSAAQRRGLQTIALRGEGGLPAVLLILDIDGEVLGVLVVVIDLNLWNSIHRWNLQSAEFS